MTEKEKCLFIKQYQWRNYPYDVFPTKPRITVSTVILFILLLTVAWSVWAIIQR